MYEYCHQAGINAKSDSEQSEIFAGSLHVALAAFKCEEIVEQVIDDGPANIADTGRCGGGNAEHFGGDLQHDILNGRAAGADGGETNELTGNRHVWFFGKFQTTCNWGGTCFNFRGSASQFLAIGNQAQRLIIWKDGLNVNKN